VIAASPAARASVLARLQLGIEALYRVETQLDVQSFLIDEEHRRRMGVARAPREQLLVRQDAEALELALFVDAQVLANLEANDPALGLDETNFADFCLAVEGVSHFVYLALAAAGERSVSALELELQAEVDKFVCCVLVDGGGDVVRLRRRLFDEVSFAGDLDGGERDRYRTANAEARRYAAALGRRFVAEDRLGDMLPELRRFYRLDLGGKLGHIARVA
jgi:hypothetical protein